MVSVIIPAYNAEQFLHDAIESVISQSTTDWELLVIDNGSTDSTPDIVKNYTEKDKRIHLLRHPDGGVSGARNHGIEKARGEFLAFLDADDILHPDFLTILLSAIQTTDADLAAATFSTFSKEVTVSPAHRLNPLLIEGRQLIPYLLYQTPVANTNAVFDTSVWGKIYRKELWQELRMRENSKFEDLDILYLVLEDARKVAFLAQPLLYYRIHDGSFIHSFTPSRLDVLAVCDRMVNHFETAALSGHCDECLRAARTRRFAAACNTLILLADKGQIYDAERKLCLKIIKETRKEVSANRKARAKDRLGALISLVSPKLLHLLSRMSRLRP